MRDERINANEIQKILFQTNYTKGKIVFLFSIISIATNKRMMMKRKKKMKNVIKVNIHHKLIMRAQITLPLYIIN